MTDSIGVDLGGTKILAAVVADGKVVRSEKRRTPRGGPAAVADEIADMLGTLKADASSVGVGVPGPVAGGSVHHAPNLAGWDQVVPFIGLLAERLGSVHIALVNDADAGTFAERTVGAASGSDDVLGLWWGTGVGGGLVLDGRLRVGPSGSAGEIGHVPVDICRRRADVRLRPPWLR